MCVMSMVMDRSSEFLRPYAPQPYAVPFTPYQPATNPWIAQIGVGIPSLPKPVDPEIVKLIQSMIDGARQYDRETGQPDCELDKKKATLKALADQLGVKIKID